MSGTFIDCLDSVPGDAIALIDDARQLTYGEVRQAAQQIAGVLHDRWGTGKYVVLRARSDIEFVTSLLGIMYSGNTPVPINPELSEADVQDIQKKSRAAHVLDPIDHATLQDRKPIDRRDAAVPSLILFTSGTSGHPKGVIISHSNLVHSCAAISRYLDYDQYRSAAVVLPLHYSYALLSQVYCQLFVGGRVRLFGNFRNPIRFSQFEIGRAHV